MDIRSILAFKGTDVLTIRSTETIENAVRLMWQREISALVVCDDGRRIDGIVSDRGIIRAMADQGTDIMAKPVSHVMTRTVLTCTPADKVEAVMTLMTEKRIRHVPVADEEGLLTGLVSIGDVVRAQLDAMKAETEHMREYIGGGI